MKRITIAAALAMLAGCSYTGPVRHFELGDFRCTVTGTKVEVSEEGIKAAAEGAAEFMALVREFRYTPPVAESTKSEEQLPIDRLITACKTF